MSLMLLLRLILYLFIYFICLFTFSVVCVTRALDKNVQFVVAVNFVKYYPRFW